MVFLAEVLGLSAPGALPGLPVALRIDSQGAEGEPREPRGSVSVLIFSSASTRCVCEGRRFHSVNISKPEVDMARE